MKKKFKLMGLIGLAFFISFLSVPFQSLAAGQSKADTTITIGKVEGQIGSVVEVPVKMNNSNKKIAAYGMEINYDKEALKVVGVKGSYGSTSASCSNGEDGCFWVNYDNTKGFLRAAWADPSAGDHPIENETTLFIIQIEIQSNAHLGEKSLSIQTGNTEALTFTDVNNHPLTVNVNPGKLTITKKEVTNTPGTKDGDKGNHTTPSKGTSEDDNHTPNINKLPQTSDDSYIDTYLNIGIAAILVILVALWIYKKRQRVNQD